MNQRILTKNRLLGVCLGLIGLMLSYLPSHAQCTNESVVNGRFNTDIAGWTSSNSGWEYRSEYGGIIRNWLDNGIDVLTQNITNANVTGGHLRLTFDVKMTEVNSTNSALIVRYAGTDYLAINVSGSNSAVTPIAQNGSIVSAGASGLVSGDFGKVTLLIPHADGLASGDLQFVHSAVASENDVELDNISIITPCATSSGCGMTAVSNGTFSNGLNGWTVSGAGAANWAYQSENGGRVWNAGDNTSQTISQLVNNVGVTDGKIDLSFDMIMQHVSDCAAGTKLEVKFGGVQYLTVTMFTANSITVTSMAGASVTSSSGTIINYSPSNIKLRIPWAGATPASGLLEFTHNTIGCDPMNSNDVVLDNIVVGAECICSLANNGNIINYCESPTVATNCGEQYFYYLPAAAANERNDPSALQITTEMPSANIVIRNANGAVATSANVTASDIYTYATAPANMFTDTYQAAFNDKGFIIESDQPLTVRWTLNHSENQSLVVLHGKNGLGTAFRVASVMNTSDEDGPHYFTVMATEDNTLVQMGAPVLASVILNRGQQYTYSGENIPVSGILIQSDKQVVVNSGQQHKNIANGSTSKEATNIQVLPIRSLGKEYVILTTEGRNGYQVVAVHYNTEVRVDGTLIAVLNPGESYQYYEPTPTSPSDLRYGKPSRITTSSPAYVYNIGTNDIGEFEMFQAPPLDLPVGKGSKVVYSAENGQSGWVIVDQGDAAKLKRNGSSSLGTVNTWVLPQSGGSPAKQVVYWHGGFAPDPINQITCDDCNSMYVGQLRDNGLQGAQIGYINGFDTEPIQFYNTNLLPDQLLTFGYTIDTVSYAVTPAATLSHVLTEANSAGGLHITSVNLSRASGNSSVGSVASFSGLNFTLNLPPAGSVSAPGDELGVVISTEDAAGNKASICLNILLKNDPTSVTISGTVFHDPDAGNVNNSSGVANTIPAGLYANLVSVSTGAVVAAAVVGTDGNYGFENVAAGDYKVVLSTENGVLNGQLPANWGNTGSYNGAPDTGNNGVSNGESSPFTIIPSGSLANINFGIQQLPVAGSGTNSATNPNGAVQVEIPAATFINTIASSDADGDVNFIRLPSFPVGATSVVINGIMYSADVPADVVALTALLIPTDANGAPSWILTADPEEDGATQLMFNFVAIDNAGAESTNPGSATLNLTSPLTVSGSVFNDGNGLNGSPLNTVDGTAIQSLSGTMLHANLFTAAGAFVATVPVDASGNYILPVSANSNYFVTISTIPAGTGSSPASSTELLANWMNIGENIGTNAGSDGTPDGILPITVGSSEITNANFGINQRPESDIKLVTLGSQPSQGQFLTLDGSANALPLLTGTDAEDLPTGGSLENSTLAITGLPDNGELWYNGIKIEFGADNTTAPSPGNPFVITNFNPALLQIELVGTGYTSTTFQYAYVDAAGAIDLTPAPYTISWEFPLPVVLIDFQVNAIENLGVLSWSTSSEVNSDYFDVQRSADGDQWITIGREAASRQSTGTRKYGFEDSAPVMGTSYYRLKMVDFDGSFAYSTIRALRMEQSGSYVIYPNPVSTQLFIRGIDRQKISGVSIINSSGVEMYKARTVDVEGVDVSTLAAGVYSIVLKTQAGRQVFKMYITR